MDNYEEIIQEDIEDPDNPLNTCIVHVEDKKVDHDIQPERFTTILTMIISELISKKYYS
jgi:hypothetical protein